MLETVALPSDRLWVLASSRSTHGAPTVRHAWVFSTSALVFRRAPRRYDAVLDLLAGDPTLSRLDAERMEFGMTHAEVGAAALSVMRFPAEMVEAIGSHHTPPAQVTSTLGRVLVAADSVAIEIDQVKSEQNAPLGEALEALEMPADAGESLLAEVRADQDNLAGFLTVR